MPDHVDLSGRRFGWLRVSGPTPSAWRDRRWLCRCACGVTVVAATPTLVRGLIRSCGCASGESSVVQKERKRCAGCGKRQPRAAFLPHAKGR